jgi:hypothetical protein
MVVSDNISSRRSGSVATKQWLCVCARERDASTNWNLIMRWAVALLPFLGTFPLRLSECRHACSYIDDILLMLSVNEEASRVGFDVMIEKFGN